MWPVVAKRSTAGKTDDQWQREHRSLRFQREHKARAPRTRRPNGRTARKLRNNSSFSNFLQRVRTFPLSTSLLLECGRLICDYWDHIASVLWPGANTTLHTSVHKFPSISPRRNRPHSTRAEGGSAPGWTDVNGNGCLCVC